MEATTCATLITAIDEDAAFNHMQREAQGRTNDSLGTFGTTGDPHVSVRVKGVTTLLALSFMPLPRVVARFCVCLFNVIGHLDLSDDSSTIKHVLHSMCAQFKTDAIVFTTIIMLWKYCCC